MIRRLYVVGGVAVVTAILLGVLAQGPHGHPLGLPRPEAPRTEAARRPSAREAPGEDAPRDPGAGMVSGCLALVEQARDAHFETLSSFAALADGSDVEGASRLWASRFFQPAADPYRPGALVERTIHQAAASPPELDFLCHVYTVSDLRLTVSETLGWVHVEVSGSAVDELLHAPVPERPARVNRIAARLLAVTGGLAAPEGVESPAWSFRFPPVVEDGVRFRTTDANPLWMSDWTARIDGGIRGRRLWLLMYKRERGAPGGLVWPAPDHWFDGEARRGLGGLR